MARRRANEPKDDRPLLEQRKKGWWGICQKRAAAVPPLTPEQVEHIERLGEAIWTERVEREMHRRDVAGVPAQTLRNIELGMGRVRASTLERIARGLGNEALADVFIEIAGPAIAAEKVEGNGDGTE